MYKLVYLGLSVLELSKKLIMIFWYEYVKPKHGQIAKLYYMDTDNLYRQKQIIFITTLQKMMKLDLILQIMNQIDHCLKKEIKK